MRFNKTLIKRSKTQTILGAIALALGCALIMPTLDSGANASVADGLVCIKATGNGQIGEMGGCETAPVVPPIAPEEFYGGLWLTIDAGGLVLPEDTLADIRVTELPSGKVTNVTSVRAPKFDNGSGMGLDYPAPRREAFIVQIVGHDGDLKGKVLAEGNFPVTKVVQNSPHNFGLTAHRKVVRP